MLVFVTGVTGQLGYEVLNCLQERGIPCVAAGRKEFELTDRASTEKFLMRIKPDAIIHCAAYTNVDGCEVNYDLANRVNGEAVENIAQAAKENDATFIHISTDYVFDGKLDVEKAYTEDMSANPVSAYGKTKYLGEQNAAKAEKYYILRTAWLYGLGGKNFVKTMLRVSNNESVSVVDDQHGSPTCTTTLCEIIEAIMEKEPEYGIYHSTNEGFTTWCGFTRKIYELAGIKTPVIALNSKEYKDAHPESSDRPTNSKLSKEKLHQAGIFPAKWEDALESYLKEELK